jgi:hypothetical protein
MLQELGGSKEHEGNDATEEICFDGVPETPIVDRPQLAVALPTGFHWRPLPRAMNFSSCSLKQGRQRFRK